MSALLERNGCATVRHVRQQDVGDAATWDRSDSLRPAALSVLAHAMVPATAGS
jgi:hypothetical protein